MNLTHLVHQVHVWFYFHISCLEALQTSCYSYTNASMSFSTFADRIIWCSLWEFSLFQGGSSFQSCLCYNVLVFSFPILTTANLCQFIFSCYGYVKLSHRVDPNGWSTWVTCHIRKVVLSCPLQWKNIPGWGKMCFCNLYLIPSGLIMPVNHLLR